MSHQPAHHRASVLALAAASLLLAPAFVEAQDDDTLPLSSLSGTWVGKHSVKPIGSCKMEDEEMPVVLVVKVDDAGQIRISSSSAVIGSGTLSPSWQVSIDHAQRFARCNDKDRTYEVHYSGVVSHRGDDLLLEFGTEETPCPPNCSYAVQYRVRKQDVEEP
jgi:hypothetical protein